MSCEGGGKRELMWCGVKGREVVLCKRCGVREVVCSKGCGASFVTAV